MELYSGLPYWIAKNPLNNYYNPLQSDYKTDVLIIGSGITGALVAHELCNAGMDCTMIDKRDLSTGSSIASTALLQYEIDTPLSELSGMIGEESAVAAYRACLQSISDLRKVFLDIRHNPGFERVPSVFYASNRKGMHIIEKEFEIRRKHDLPVNYLNKKDLIKKYGIKAGAALDNDVSAQIDTYDAANHLINFHMKKHALEVFTHSEVKTCRKNQEGYEAETCNGRRITCKYIVIAAGFEAGKFLPEEVMKLTSTYAIVSQPVDPKKIWYKNALIWETKEPYLYIRTTGKNRIIVGGEDEEFKDPVKRDKLLRKKVKTLERKFKKLFPDIPFITDMAWCGTFSSTDDGLPFIGTWPGDDRMFYALGYGGNGITFSMIAAQIIRNKMEGQDDPREKIFGFERKDLHV